MNEIKPEHIRKFKRLAEDLDKLMHEICAYNPDAEIYVEDSWNFNLMKGPTHTEDNYQRPLHSNVAIMVSVYRSSGGGW